MRLHRRQRQRQWRRARRVIATVIALSLIALLLPSSWTQGLISTIQVFVPLMDGASRSADVISDSLTDSSSPVPVAVYEDIKREKEALAHRVAALSLCLERVEQEAALLAAARNWNIEGESIGTQGRLIPARVIQPDLLPWRDTRLVSVGTQKGAQKGAPVTSAILTIDHNSDPQLQSGLAVLQGEVLIGFVEQAGTHTSRIKLVSDPTVQMKVRVGRFQDGEFLSYDSYCWLIGQGRGQMQIADLARRDVDDKLIAAGDIVLSDPESGLIPSAMVIGRIIQIDIDTKNPLLCSAAVEAAADMHTVRRVYVFDPSSDTSE